MTKLNVLEKALIEIVSESAEQTFRIGFDVGRKARHGDTFALSGELGAGKTCFTGGLARGLDVDEEYAITSPTFTLINEYPGRCRLCHFDVYRLNHPDELDDLGFEEFVSGSDVVVIEWAEKIVSALPMDTIRIRFVYVDENKRKITISGPQKRVQDIVQDIQREV
jgi:tRNA threonylcarbamoyladenosine biosynthesis protein TsaE